MILSANCMTNRNSNPHSQSYKNRCQHMHDLTPIRNSCNTIYRIKLPHYK